MVGDWRVAPRLLRPCIWSLYRGIRLIKAVEDQVKFELFSEILFFNTWKYTDHQQAAEIQTFSARKNQVHLIFIRKFVILVDFTSKNLLINNEKSSIPFKRGQLSVSMSAQQCLAIRYLCNSISHPVVLFAGSKFNKLSRQTAIGNQNFFIDDLRLFLLAWRLNVLKIIHSCGLFHDYKLEKTV